MNFLEIEKKLQFLEQDFSKEYESAK